MFYKYYKYLYNVMQFPILLRNQWRTLESITAMQNKKLRKIVRHVYENVPYYRELFDSSGILPSDIQSKEDLPKLPILTKQAVRENYPERILAKNIDLKNCSVRGTSGSSGNVLQIAIDLTSTYLYQLHQFRQLLDIGYEVTDRIAYIRYGGPATKIVFQKLGFFRRDYVSLTLSPRDQISELLQIKPNAINAYPSVLYLLAKNIEKEEAEYLNLKFILSNSELLYDSARKTIEDTFNCKVYDDYSCLEFSAIGYECKEQHMHIVCDNVIVEVVDENGRLLPDGEEGRLIVTALNNKVMPYMRYEIDDIGSVSPEKCGCGRGFPIFKSFLGRRDDFLLMPDGTLLGPQTAGYQVGPVPGVVEWQLIQQDRNLIEVNAVFKENTDTNAAIETIRNGLRSVIPEPIEFEVSAVEKLNRGKTGKLRSVHSRCLDQSG